MTSPPEPHGARKPATGGADAPLVLRPELPEAVREAIAFTRRYAALVLR